MSTSFSVSKNAANFEYSYTFEEQILLFWSGVKASSLKDEDRVILEIYSPSKRVIMHVSSKTPFPYFNFFLHFIKYMGVLFHSSPFYMEILRVFNFAPS